MGTDEYSYHFVIEAFRPVLERIGDVHTVRHLDDVEPIRAECETTGESCVILSFVPPHKTTLFMRVPLIPVFAWEYETIPYEVWDEQPKHDWRMVLQQQGRAITLSTHSAAVVRATMGKSFPAVGIPPPVFDRLTSLRERIGGKLPTPVVLDWDGICIDTAALDISPEMVVPPVPEPLSVTPAEPVLKKSDAHAIPVDVGLAADPERPHAPSLKAATPLSSRIPRKLIELYRDELRPSTPPVLAKIISVAGRAAWHAKRRLRSALKHDLALPKKTPNDIGVEATSKQQRVIVDIESPAGHSLRASRSNEAGPVFQMPPPLDSLPIPLPLARPMSLTTTADSQRQVGGEAVFRGALRQPLQLNGVVYFAVVNPLAGRKNWNDLISAFTWAFRDTPDAVLVVKVVGRDPGESWRETFESLSKQPAFTCRVVLIYGFLSDEQMGVLLAASSYVVNTSSGEGCALPLLEGMSVGRPAIAPDHTAMTDYIDASNSFIVTSHLEVTAFPHDSRVARRTLWRLPQWDSLRDCFTESYRLARDDPERWLLMANRAMEAQQTFCNDHTVERHLRDFLGAINNPLLAVWTKDLSSIPIEITDRQKDAVE